MLPICRVMWCLRSCRLAPLGETWNGTQQHKKAPNKYNNGRSKDYRSTTHCLTLLYTTYLYIQAKLMHLRLVVKDKKHLCTSISNVNLLSWSKVHIDCFKHTTKYQLWMIMSGTERYTWFRGAITSGCCEACIEIIRHFSLDTSRDMCYAL